MEHCFTINLGILPSVLCVCRSLEVRGGPKPRGRRLNSRTSERKRTPDSRQASHTKLILQQNRNTTLNIKKQPTQSHSIPTRPKTHYWTLNCTPEKRDLAPTTSTQTQVPLNRKPWQATGPTPPTGTDTTMKRNHDLPACRKDTANTAIYTEWKGREMFSRWRIMIKTD